MEGEEEQVAKGPDSKTQSAARLWNRSHFTFCHETKCLQITNRIVSLGVNQHRTHLRSCFL